MDDDDDAVARYLCVARLDGRDHVILWESGGDVVDRVVLDESGFIVAFHSELAAREAASPDAAPISPDEPSVIGRVYDLDAIDAWCKSEMNPQDCRELLSAWNLFVDLPCADVFREADTRALGAYDKLFWGSNLPAMTPPGQEYVPSWTPFESATIKRVLLLGLAEFRARLR